MNAALRILQGTIGQMPEAYALAVAGSAELVSKGFADPRSAIYPAQKCYLAQVTENGRDWNPAGVLTYRIEEEIGMVYIDLSYVQPEYRGRRIYSLMYAGLRAHALDRKCRTIHAGTHVKNTVMRAVAARMGRPETFVLYLDDLEPVLSEVTPAE